MQVRGTHHVAIGTANFDQLVAFYSETLGLPAEKRWDGANIVFIDLGDTQIELLDRPDASENGQGGWVHLAFHVDDVDATYAELEAAGVDMRVAPKDFQTVRIAFFADPDGNLLELVQDSKR